MLLLLLLLMMVHIVNMQLTAEMFSCSDETKYPVLHFAEYTHIRICCQLLPKYCNETTSNDTLTLLPAFETGCNGSCASQMYRESKCLVKFEISNASFLDQGLYLCKLNDIKLMAPDVYIIKKPPTPVITAFSCSHEKLCSVTFDRGPPSTEYNDSYEVTMTELRKTYIMCNTTQEVCKPSNRICVCNKVLSNSVSLSSKVNISVAVSRSFQTSEAIKTFPFAAHIIPGPVKRLNVSHVGPHDACIQFCMDHFSRSSCSFMAFNNAPLYYNMRVFKDQGVMEILKVTIPTALDDHPYCVNQCFRVNLPNLTAFTNYTVIVSGSGGGGESPKSQLTFLTSETEPVCPPLIEDFGFRRLEGHVSDNLLTGLILIWKPLPHEAKGSRELSYYVEVTSENGFQVSKTTADAYAVILDKNLPSGPLSVKLWSQNVLGRSQNYTRFDVPPKIPETAVPNVVVELKEDRAFVYVNLTLRTDVTLLVHWCYTDTIQTEDGVNICQDYPSMAAFNLKAATNRTYHTLTVNISDNMELEVIQDYRLIHYYNLNFLNSALGMPITSNATVILNDLRAIQDIKDQEFYVEYLDSSDDDIYYEVSRKRRYVPKLGSSSAAKIRFFISFKMGESMSSTGLIPASCYYDATKDQVSLIVSDFRESNNGNSILRWSQECNTDKPLQFLPDYFHVYSSTDEYCSKNKEYIDRVNNSLFQPKFLKLPPDTKFTCIQAFRQDGKYAAELTTSSVSSYYKESTSVLVYILVPLAVTVFIMILAVLIVKCQNRKKVIEKLQKRIELPTKNKFDAAPHPVISRSTSNEGQLTGSSYQISINSSTDSGRGTDNDRKHVNSDDMSYKESMTSSSGGTVTGSSSDRSSHLNSDLPGSSSNSRQDLENESSSYNIEENDGSTSFQAVNENSDTDDERSNESGRSQKSITDCDQQKAFDRQGFSFSANNDSSSSSCSAMASGNTNSGDLFSERRVGNSGRKVNSCNSITEENSSCDREEKKEGQAAGTDFQQHDVSFCSNNDIRRSFKCPQSADHFRQQLKENNPHDAECKSKATFNRCFSSGSESEGDVERPLMNFSHSFV